MRLALLTGGAVPNPTTGGGALTCFTLVSHFLREGHEVDVCVVRDPDPSDPTDTGADARSEVLRRLGASVQLVDSAALESVRGQSTTATARIARAWRPAERELYPQLVDAERVRDLLAEVDPDAVFVYHWEGLAASALVRAPRFVAGGDLTHVAHYSHWRASWPSANALRGAVRLQAVLRHQPRLLARMLAECEASGDFAAHHAQWFRRHGVAACEYLRTPIPEPADREPVAPEGRPALLLLGHLKGAVTIDGLRVFARALPHLERELREGVHIDIVGGFEPPPGLESLFSHPAVRRHGHTEAVGDWLRGSHVMVVPTSIPLGIRVRILTAFSYGCCVVTHRANALGIPELAHGENCLLADSPESLAREIARAVRDPELRRRLGAGGRATYERYFSPVTAGARVLSVLDALGSG